MHRKRVQHSFSSPSWSHKPVALALMSTHSERSSAKRGVYGKMARGWDGREDWGDSVFRAHLEENGSANVWLARDRVILREASFISTSTYPDSSSFVRLLHLEILRTS